MKLRWKYCLYGYIISIISVYVLFIFTSIFIETPPIDIVGVLVVFPLFPFIPHLIIMPIGFFIGCSKEKKEPNVNELTIKKIQKWKDEGYNVEELEKMIEKLKSESLKGKKDNRKILAKQPKISSKQEPDRICPDCARAIPFNAKVCPYCGKKFEEY